MTRDATFIMKVESLRRALHSMIFKGFLKLIFYEKGVFENLMHDAKQVEVDARDPKSKLKFFSTTLQRTKK